MQFQAQSKRFATQKQCFCPEWLSAPNCLFALRFKRKCRSSRPRIMQLEIVDSHAVQAHYTYGGIELLEVVFQV
ncbi:hypothetical protein HMPREF1574_01300 [Gardnerella pickettii JCP7659]|uniref:hypothetical protein n=1 Tax=Gardnerella pickettii TaxID=2914924 RepID=UPI0003535B98|nr:hypothetical protein [Gardnerella pickettii]EPI54089.1 hypothetical protein HMPREF1574_01300 [Gardnerella pickettii JCP7659]